MKALNNKEITNKYLIFLANFSILLVATVLCWFLYLKTCDAQASKIIERKSEYDFIFNKREQLLNKVDSINNLLGLLNTNQVENEVALERKILEMKNEANRQLVALEAGSNGDYILFKKIIDNVEKALDNKKALQQAIADEKNIEAKLRACIDGNEKIKKELTNNSN